METMELERGNRRLVPLSCMSPVIVNCSGQRACETRLWVSGGMDKSWIFRSRHAATALPLPTSLPIPRRQEHSPRGLPALPHVEASPLTSRKTALTMVTRRPRHVAREQGSRGLPLDSASEHDEHAQLRARVWAKMQASGESLETLLPMLRKVGIFRNLSDPELFTLYHRGSHRAFPRYAAVIRRGGVARGYFVLLSGTVECKSALGVTQTLQAGASVGEEALAGCGARREASVAAVTVCYFLCFDPSDLHGLPVDMAALQDTRLAAVLLEGAQRCRVFCRELEAVAWLNKLPRDVLEKVAALFEEVLHFTSGEVVYEEGEPERVLYVMVEGRVELRKGTRSSPQGLLADRGQAEAVTTLLGSRVAESQMPWFGEAALAQHRTDWQVQLKRKETATCAGPTKLLPLRAKAFAAFLDLVPTFPLPTVTIAEPQKPSAAPDKESLEALSRRELTEKLVARDALFQKRLLRRTSNEILHEEARAARGAKVTGGSKWSNEERLRGITSMQQ